MRTALSLFAAIFSSMLIAVGSQAADVTPSVPHAPQAAHEKWIFPISSRKQLDEALQQGFPPDSPLYLLDEDDRAAFLSSIVFTANGIGGFNYSGLQQLSWSEAYKVLAVFGMQQSLTAMRGLKSQSDEDESVLKWKKTVPKVCAENYRCDNINSICVVDYRFICCGPCYAH